LPDGTTSYNETPGPRHAALSESIFNLAMKLLVLNLSVPAAETIHSGQDSRHMLDVVAPL
jgi:hypothetical protein